MHNNNNNNNNITCIIDDVEDISDETNTWSSIELDSENTDNENNVIDNELYAMELNYKLNYTTKYLGHIIDYYGISKTKLNKDGIIRKIVEFELDLNNIAIVERRKYLFENMEELKNDSFFKKFIIWNI